MLRLSLCGCPALYLPPGRLSAMVVPFRRVTNPASFVWHSQDGNAMDSRSFNHVVAIADQA
jgi:hypothetical protein